MKKLLFFWLLTSLLWGCAGIPKGKLTEAGTPPLFGMIYDTTGNPLSGANIILDNMPCAVSDSCGRFILENVSTGKHILLITKEGFEANSLRIYFSNPGQVLYAVLIPMESILEDIKEALLKGQVEAIPGLIKRAEDINSDNLKLLYLKAVYSIKKNQFQKSLETVETLIKNLPVNPYLLLTKAQIMFYGVGQKEKALETLSSIPNSMGTDEVSRFMKIVVSENQKE